MIPCYWRTANQGLLNSSLLARSPDQHTDSQHAETILFVPQSKCLYQAIGIVAEAIRDALFDISRPQCTRISPKPTKTRHEMAVGNIESLVDTKTFSSIPRPTRLRFFFGTLPAGAAVILMTKTRISRTRRLREGPQVGSANDPLRTVYPKACVLPSEWFTSFARITSTSRCFTRPQLQPPCPPAPPPPLSDPLDAAPCGPADGCDRGEELSQKGRAGGGSQCTS